MERRQQQWGLKTFLILCVCVFCVYEIQDVALENMDKYHHQISPAPKPILSVMDIHSLSDQGAHHDVSHITDDIHQEQRAAQVWITMALCWSANAQVHGKENFPYKDAAPLSSQLWMNITKISRKKSTELYYFPNFSASRCLWALFTNKLLISLRSCGKH